MFIKKFITAFICAIMLSLPVYAAESQPRVKTDGLIIHLTNKPIIEDGIVMLDAADIGRVIKGQSSWDITTKTASVRKGSNVIQYKTAADEWYLNKNPIDIKPAPVIKDGTAYLPVIAVTKPLGVKASWDKKTNVILINTGADYLALDIGTPPAAASVYTFERAVAIARDNNSSVTDLEESITLLEKSKEIADDSLRDAFEFSYPYEALIGILRQADMIENSLSKIPLTKTIYRDSSEAMVRNSALNIKTGQLDRVLLEETIALEEQNIKNLELKLSLGVIAESEVKSARLTLRLYEENLKLLQLSEDAEAQALNGVLRLSLTSDIAVTYELSGKQWNVRNINSYIEETIRNAPTIKIKEMTLAQAEYKKNTSSYSIDETGIDLIQTENDYNAALRDLNDSKYNLEKSIRSLYSQLKQVEGRRAGLAIELEKAIDAYNNAVTSYEAGMIISFTVQQARLGILRAEAEIAKNEINYERLYHTLLKPYLTA